MISSPRSFIATPFGATQPSDLHVSLLHSGRNPLTERDHLISHVSVHFGHSSNQGVIVE